MSPYLFILCVEGILGLTMKVEMDNTIKGVVVARRSPSMSHLFFYDIFIFIEVNDWAYNRLKQILVTYKRVSE